MNNLSFSRPSPDGDKFSVSFGMFVQTEHSDGSVSLDPVKDPYEGLLGESFSLQAQLDAGVPLQKIGNVSSGLLSEVDKSNFNASNFMSNLESEN